MIVSIQARGVNPLGWANQGGVVPLLVSWSYMRLAPRQSKPVDLTPSGLGRDPAPRSTKYLAMRAPNCTEKSYPAGTLAAHHSSSFTYAYR